MSNSDAITITIFVVIILHSFLFGYFFGLYRNNNGVTNSSASFFTKQKEAEQVKTSISIDDKKFVTEIRTDSLEKKYDSLGDVKSTSENISGSVNKLKNLKG